MGEVQDAIILAGGRGTRMLPASLYMPKETMPLVDTPVLNHLIWEAAKAGASKIHLVLSSWKMDLLSGHLGDLPIHGPEVRSDLPRQALKLGIEGIEIVAHIQEVAMGVADAISVALPYISGPFLVLLGDNLLLSEHVGPPHSGTIHASNASKMLVSQYKKNHLPCVGILQKEEGELGNYGVVELSGTRVTKILEKPSVEEAPSNYVLCGRYLLPGDTNDILDKYVVEEFGELQSISLLHHLIRNSGLEGVKMDSMRMYDSGEPLSWLKSQIDHALMREDMSEELLSWLRQRTAL